MKTSRHVWQLVLWALVVSNCVYKVMWRFLMQRYVFPATFATVNDIFPVTFNYFNAFSPTKIYDACIWYTLTPEGARKSKNQPFSMFFFENG